MQHRTIRGTILYTSKKPERMDQRRGIEYFTFTQHGDGKVTMRAQCEIEEPEPTVLRDIIFSLDENRRPMDCHVRLTVGDRFMGSGWFRFTEDAIECESYGPSIGRVSQKMPITGPFDGFGTHPVVADGYFLSTLAWEEGQRRTLNVKLPSPDHRGATPPLIANASIDAIYLGKERLSVQAGSFDSRHFRFIDEGAGSGFAGQHPPYDVWVTDDDDAIMLQGGVGGYMMTWYELISLERHS